LATAGAGIILCTDPLEKRFERGDAKHKAKRAVAIIGINPIYAGTKK
jgi:hypothetical protein